MSVVRFFRPAAVILGLGIATAPHTFDRPRRLAELPTAGHARIQDRFGKLPLSFIENRGQDDERVAYTLRSPGHTTYFTPEGLTLRLTQGQGQDARAHTIQVDLVGAATDRIESRKSSSGVVSYFRGSRDQWKTAIPTHESIGYVQPWPGIDLAYRGHDGRLESVYTVAPHADPARIKLRYSGQNSLALDHDGNLVLSSSVGDVRETAPIVYQEIDARRVPVDARYALLDDNTVAFDVAKYDPDHALVIDPMLEYAGFIGGTGTDEGRGIAVDSAGNAYVTGFASSTESESFPLTVGPDLTYNGGLFDAFVAKVSADGSTLAYVGYIGGAFRDEGSGIAVDAAGNAYVTGWAGSTEANGFPVTVGPDLTHNASEDAFIAKVSADGTTLIYCGYIGGSGGDRGYGVAVDSTGNAYVTGHTNSTAATFPEIVGPDLTENGGKDAFVAKVSADGTALLYAGYIGGSQGLGTAWDDGLGIAVDGAGSAYVTGVTSNTEAQGFPVTIGPDLTYNGGTNDAFVAKVMADGSALVYAGYIGGSGDEPNIGVQGSGIAVDSAGNAYVSGSTTSSEATFPVLVGPDLTYGGVRDAYVAKVMADGSALVYAGYIGTGNGGRARAIAVDSAGSAYVTGVTGSGLAATVGPDLTYNGGGFDAFVAKVMVDGSALEYSGYIGGSGDDEGWGIAVDGAGNAYVTGDTSSSGGFPVAVGPNLTFGGVVDAFVVKVVPSVNTAPVAGDDTASTLENTPVAIPIAMLLVNDTDAEFDPLTLTAVTQGTNGAVAIVGTDVVYTPAMGFSGMDSFDYTIEDPSNATAMATVTVTVTAVGGADGGDGGAVADATPGEDGGDAEDGAVANDTGSSPDPDAGPGEEDSEGCGCALGRSPRPDPRALWLFALLLLRRRAVGRAE